MFLNNIPILRKYAIWLLIGVVVYAKILVIKGQSVFVCFLLLWYYPDQKQIVKRRTGFIFCLQIIAHHCVKSERGSRQEQSRKQKLCVNAFSWLDSQGLLSYYPSSIAQAHLSRDPRAHTELGPPIPVRGLPHRYGVLFLIVSPFSEISYHVS